MTTTPLITGEETWLETPAGRSWAALHKGASDGYRWSPNEVGIDLKHAHRILSAAGRAGPRAYGGSWFGEAGGGASHRSTEWTWAEEVSGWPQRYLLRRNPMELDAVALHIRKASGERLTDPERKAIASRTHRDRRHRGFVVIAAGLMRDKVRNTRPGEGIIDDGSEAGNPVSDDRPPSYPTFFRAPPTPEEAALMPEPYDVADIARAIVQEARGRAGDLETHVNILAREAAEEWFAEAIAENPNDACLIVRLTKVTVRFRSAALVVIREHAAA